MSEEMVRDIIATRQRVARIETAEYATMQVGAVAPAHNAAEGVLYFDTVNNDLFVNSDGANAWQLIAGGGGAVAPHNILSISHADTTTDVPTRGSLIVGNSTPLWDELVIGAAATMLGSDGVDATWTALFDAVVPNVIQPDDAAATGAAVVAARRDHEHGIVCAAPGANLSVSTANAEGAAVNFSRSDHSHAITSSSNPGAAASLLATDASGNVSVQDLTALDDIYLADILYRSGDTDTYIDGNDDQWIIAAGGVEFLRLTEAGQDILVVNEGGVDIDFRVEGIGAVNALFVQGSNGNVGIGTAAPATKLEIAGTQGTLFVDVNTWAGVVAVHSDDAATSLDFTNTATGGDTRLYATEDVIFRTSTTDPAVTIKKGGNVGIGIAGPLAKTHIDQASTTAAIPVLYLDQADLSEEMIEFNTTIGVGNPIEAVGSKLLEVTHFVRVNIPGLARYMQVGYIYTPS